MKLPLNRLIDFLSMKLFYLLHKTIRFFSIQDDAYRLQLIEFLLMQTIKNGIPNFYAHFQTMKRTILYFYLYYVFKFKFKM